MTIWFLGSRRRLSPCCTPVTSMISWAVYLLSPETATSLTRKNTMQPATMAARMSTRDRAL